MQWPKESDSPENFALPHDGIWGLYLRSLFALVAGASSAQQHTGQLTHHGRIAPWGRRAGIQLSVCFEPLLQPLLPLCMPGRLNLFTLASFSDAPHVQREYCTDAASLHIIHLPPTGAL